MERYAGGGPRNQPFHPAMMFKMRREAHLSSITTAKQRLETRQRETEREQGRGEDDDQQPRNPGGSVKRGPRYKRQFGIT